jgi:hypothetical protein
MIRKFLKSVVGKIVLGYVMIITVALITTFVSLYIINKNNQSDKITTEVLFPSIVKLKAAEKLCSDSYLLITSWVKQPNDDDKKALNNLIAVEYPKFKSEYSSLIKDYSDDSTQVLSKAMLKSFDNLFESHSKIKEILKSDEVYA